MDVHVLCDKIEIYSFIRVEIYLWLKGEQSEHKKINVEIEKFAPKFNKV